LLLLRLLFCVAVVAVVAVVCCCCCCCVLRLLLLCFASKLSTLIFECVLSYKIFLFVDSCVVVVDVSFVIFYSVVRTFLLLLLVCILSGLTFFKGFGAGDPCTKIRDPVLSISTGNAG